MTKDEIGNFAGPIYEALKDGATLTTAELKKETGFKDAELYLGMGWLFCQDKLYSKNDVEKKKAVVKYGWK